jgi:maltokinase
VIDQGLLHRALDAHLAAHIERQRWSGAPEGGIVEAKPAWLEVVSDDPLLAWMVVEATLANGAEQRYQLFLGGRPGHPWPDFLEGKDRELLAVLPDGEGDDVVFYDALIDPDLAIAVLHLVSPESEVEVRRPIVLEHSNSSVVFDERSILKILRKVESGPNPDVEIPRVLADRGFENVLPPIAELRRDDTDLAVLRDFLVGATEGWQIARASIRDLLASRLPPEDSGADFAPDAARLGSVIAELHLAMADAWGSATGAPADWVDMMAAGLDEVVGAIHGGAAEALDVEAVRARFDDARRLDDAGADIRIHGDLHLAQVIQIDGGWLVLDFEGEPARRRDDRFTHSSPLRDVAGMLRSLHYAAATGLAEWDQGDDELASLLEAWEQRNRDAFLTAYLGEDGIEALLPADPTSRTALLTAFELDKAVYELGYEIGHRPDLVSIPLAGIDRLVARAVPS